MRVGSLCTGIGGLDLAVEAWFGAETVWVAEYEEHLDPILQREFGPVLNLRDLTTVSWDELEPVDILTAGYPCQPFSHAGKRKGSSDARHLWPYIYEGVRTLRPRYVVLENVRGHLSMGFDTVLGDLAEAGFDAEWCLLRASDVGACHQRARIFVVARNTDREGLEGRSAHTERGHERATRPAGLGPPPDSDDRRDREARTGALGGVVVTRRGQEPSLTTDTGGKRYGGGQDAGTVGRVDLDHAGQAWERERARPVVGDRGHAVATDAGGVGRGPGAGLCPVEWGRYEPAVRRWEYVLGRPAPAPTTDGKLSPAFVEWMMGYPQGWVDGLTRTQALKALGNAVVPQQALAALAELT